MMLLLALFLGEIYHFNNATVYDAQLNGLREDVSFTVGRDGIVGPLSTGPLTAPKGAVVFEEAVILPHLSDFYSLIQERGFGHDEDFSAAVQGRIARYFRQIGMGAFRDPVFPSTAVNSAFAQGVETFAMRGYLDLPGGPARGFSLDADPGKSYADIYKTLPDRGPVTLWWTAAGMGIPLAWDKHENWLKGLIDFLHQRGRKVGAYIQDASPADLKLLHSLPMDFYEGIPDADNTVAEWPERVIWVPMAALNDKRYCAAKLAARINQLAGKGLYDSKTLTLAQDRLDSVGPRIAQRCRVWKKRRTETLKLVEAWLERGGKVALASAGGHLFSFSGDILSELEALDGIGADQEQLLAAAFVHTPQLLGFRDPYLQEGRPANFIVYELEQYWVNLIGKGVALNFSGGKTLDIK